MRSSVILLAIYLLTFSATDAHAQDAGAQLSAETVAPSQRTPALVLVNERIPAAPPIKTPADAGKQQASSAGKAAGKKEAAPLPASAAIAPPNPIVLQPAYSSDQQVGAYSADTTGNLKYDELVRQAAARYGVDPGLIMAVMRQESGFNPRARSYKGATGLMQLMPATARRFGVGNILDPAQNIEGGTRYLRFLLDMFNGDVKLALAGYNAGEGAVVKYGYQVPRYRETQNYVQSISARYGRSKHKAGRVAQAAGSSGPQAPAAVTFTGGVSTRLSNNY